MAGSPAEEAGVQRGDCLQAVAGRLVGPLAAAEVEATQRTRAGGCCPVALLLACIVPQSNWMLLRRPSAARGTAVATCC